MSGISDNWLSKIFRKVPQAEPKPAPVAAPKPTPTRDSQPSAAYKKGDFIGQTYEVQEILGKGGFGVVYLVYKRATGEVYALKTFRDEFLADQDVRKRFHKEASVWVELGRHPYLVRADIVDEVSARLYIRMQYIAPNEEGLNSLEGYLQRRPPDLAQSLRWAIQVCHGMEYAYAKGVRAHRDLKPANIMIGQDLTIRITDFGLAGVISESPAMRATGSGARRMGANLSGRTLLGAGFGTPTHMPPEQFDSAAGCDERSDLYSFGIVLYQMAAGGRLPFLAPMPRDGGEQAIADFWQAMQRLHRESPVPRLDSPLFPIIRRCLEKSPDKRYPTFKQVRALLEPLLLHCTGEVIVPPQAKELEAQDWADKGFSLDSLGRLEDALDCYDRALELNPRSISAWNNKGVSLRSLGRHDEAISCCERALELAPCEATAWHGKGNVLLSLGRHNEALGCFDKALELNPRLIAAWASKGNSLDSLGRHDEAIRCLDKALELDPRHVIIWNNKGIHLNHLGRYEEAIYCSDRALDLDPYTADAWANKGISFLSLGRHEEALSYFDKALELDPRLVAAWTNKGFSLRSLGRHEEALRCIDKALEVDPRFALAWTNKGLSLRSLGRHDEAICCYDKALELDLRSDVAWNNKGFSLHSLGRDAEAICCYDKALELDPRYVNAWYNKGSAEDKLGHSREAARAYQQYLALAPARQAEQIAYARQRLQELGGM